MSFFDKEEFLNGESADNSRNAGEMGSDRALSERSEAEASAGADKNNEEYPNRDMPNRQDGQKEQNESKELERKLFWGNYTDIKTGTKPVRNTGIVMFASLVSVVVVICFCVNYIATSYYGNGWLRNLFGLEQRSEYTLDLSDRPTSEREYYYEDGRYTSAGIAKELEQSVVSISSYSDINSDGYISEGRGSGIILSEDGYIVTNAHVIDNAGNDMIVVTLYDGRRYNAQVMGSDELTDIAVIKIDEKGLVPAQFGNSAQVLLGEEVYAIGNPAGLDGSISKGIVSGLDRKLTSYDYVRCIQVDAAVNPGNSGGALVNSWGQVIGIISSKLSSDSYDGIGFAICINDAKPVVDSLIKYGEVKRNTRIGIEFLSVTEEIAVDVNVPSGLYIMGIDESCDIFSSGLEIYDVITEMDGVPVAESYDVTQILLGKSPGDTITAKVYRPSDESEFTITFKLMENN